MHTVFDSLCRLLAPVLAFTADEAWRFAGNPGSVHLETFPTVNDALRDETVLGEMRSLLELRAVVAQAIEKARGEKLIGNALEASVTLHIGDAALFDRLNGREPELEEILILSELTLVKETETSAVITRTSYGKCERCWRHRPSVGSGPEPELCDRCEAEVS